MRELFDRLSAYLHWVVFLILEALSGFMLFKFNTYQGSVWLTQANTVAATIMEWEARGLQYLNLSAENAMLTRENLTLQYNLEVMRREMARLTKDSTYTERQHSLALMDETLVPARVVANSVMHKDNFLTINVGSEDGVEPEMGVVSGTGVVGIVSKVTAHHALVMSVLNSNSSISCRLRGTDYFGYMKWHGGNPLQASMDDVPRHARVKVGDVVETSGFSNVFPAGIFLGKVAQVHNSSDGLAYVLEIQMSTDLSCIENVSVVVNKIKPELDSLNIVR